MEGSAFPQCLTAMRFHEMAQEGTLSDKELIALAADPQLGGEYAALRKCDRAFQEMVTAGKRELRRQKRYGAGHAPEQPLANGLTPSETHYVGYVDCVSTALCPGSLKDWYDCMEQAKEGERPAQSCEVVKRMLERCLRAETDALFRATQQHVFRPSS